MGNFLNALFVTKHCEGLLWAGSVLNYSLTLTPHLFSALHTSSGCTAAFETTNKHISCKNIPYFWKCHVGKRILYNKSL